MPEVIENLSKRSNLEISADVLRIARKGARKTYIIRKSNLNFKIAEKYLEFLRSGGLIKGPVGLDNLFQTTEKGVKYLHHFESLKCYLERPSFEP